MLQNRLYRGEVAHKDQIYPGQHEAIAGTQDPFVPPINAEYLHKLLPKSKLDLIDALHFVWDAANTYAELVTSLWAGGYTKVGPSSHKQPWPT
jgi:pimeloyl-ACP methyl ester carboxylesterase